MATATFNMSEAFLHELFQKSNIVRLEGEKCGICFEEYNTPSRETGASEAAIRLPCNHIIGSACIATWLKDTNTCPICRRAFFQAQPRPYLEHGVFDGQEVGDDDEDDGSEIEAEDDRQDIDRTIEELCDNLGLDSEVFMISKYLVEKHTQFRLLDEGHTLWCVVAVSIYMGSHITKHPRSPREIGEVAGLDGHHLRESYDTVYPELDRFADAHLLNLLQEVFGEETVALPLNWPAPGNAVSDEEIESSRSLQLLKERCEQGCRALGLNPATTSLATRIATRYFTAEVLVELSLKEMIAASIFMACHMTWHFFDLGVVAGRLGMDESRIRDAYRAAYSHQEVLMRQPQLEGSREQSMESLLRRIPFP